MSSVTGTAIMGYVRGVESTLPNAPDPVRGFTRLAPVGMPIEARERVSRLEFEIQH